MVTTIPSLTSETFDEEVLGSELPVVVDVWAEWCQPCQALEPVLQSIADEHRHQLRVFKLNGDDHPEVIARFGVLGLPTLLVFDGGELVQRIVGAKPKRRLLEELAGVL
jgi:thioredoxin 1